MLGCGGSSVATTGMVPISSGFSGGRTSQTPMLWSLLVQPHVRKFHRGLELLHLHTWKSSNDLFARQTFVMQKSSQQILRNSQHVFIS